MNDACVADIICLAPPIGITQDLRKSPDGGHRRAQLMAHLT